jgi:hypothetical protein
MIVWKASDFFKDVEAVPLDDDLWETNQTGDAKGSG